MPNVPLRALWLNTVRWFATCQRSFKRLRLLFETSRPRSRLSTSGLVEPRDGHVGPSGEPVARAGAVGVAGRPASRVRHVRLRVRERLAVLGTVKCEIRKSAKIQKCTVEYSTP